MTHNALMKPFAICLLFTALTSCATQTQPSPTNYSALLTAETQKQKAADCATWKRDPLPKHVGDRVNLISKDPSLRTPDEQVMWDWAEADRAEVTKRIAYCTPKKGN